MSNLTDPPSPAPDWSRERIQEFWDPGRQVLRAIRGYQTWSTRGFGGKLIAKYFVLRELSIPDKQLRLIYVKATLGRLDSQVQQAHMILAYYPTPDDEPLILDNLVSEIRPASRRTDLLPVFSFNSDGIYTGLEGRAAIGPGGAGRLSRWADLLRRAHAEGF